MNQPVLKEIYLIEISTEKNNKFHEVFWKKCKDSNFDIFHVNHSSVFQKILIDKSEPTAIIMNWHETTTPHVYLEWIAQNPVLSNSPFVIFAGECSQEDIDFWQEYRIKYIVRQSGNHARDSELLLNFIEDDLKSSTRQSLETRGYRAYFNALQNSKIDQAKNILKKLEGLFNKYDAYYLKAHLLKSEKKFQEAISLLGTGLSQAKQEGLNLDARYLHLIGNVSFKAKDYERAVKFLDAAQKISPKNPRRKLILGQLSTKLGNFQKAREYFVDLYNQSKDYDAVLLPLIEHVIEHAYAKENINMLSELLDKLSERKLISIAKRYQISQHQSYDELIVIFCKHLYDAAKTLRDKDDFYGAVSIYQFARTIIKPLDLDRKFEVNLLVAETLIQSNDLNLAQKHLEKLSESIDKIRSIQLKARFSEAVKHFKSAS